MMRKTILLLITLTIYSFCFALDYRELSLGKAREFAYENNNSIFLGIPLSFENGIATFLVKEQFKGNLNNKVIVKFPYIESSEHIFSLWLIYGNLENDTIIASELLTRCVNDAFIIGVYKSATLKVARKTGTHVILEEDFTEKKLLENQWRNDFYDEIIILRSIKANQTHQNQVNSKISIWEHVLFPCILILNLVLLFGVCIYIRRLWIMTKSEDKKRNSLL